jgi:transport family protein 27
LIPSITMSSKLGSNEVVSGLRSMDSKHQSLTILRCKLVVVGDEGVGKTALTQMFESEGSRYPKNYMMTVGTEFLVKQVRIPNTNVIVELFIYDCAGQAIFSLSDIQSKYYESACAFMVVYDVTNLKSFNQCSKWLSVVKSANSSPLVGAIVANKIDHRSSVGDSRVAVDEEKGRRLAQSQDGGVAYFETSAANNIGVDDPFKYIANEFYMKYESTVARGEDFMASTSGF